MANCLLGRGEFGNSPEIQSATCNACQSERIRTALSSVEKLHSHSGYSYLECADCGTHTLHPVPDEEFLSGLYQSGKFDAHAPAARYLDPVRFAADRDQYVATLLPFIDKGRSLDFGCGSGWLVNQMTAVGFDAHGVEIEQRLVHEARQIFRGTFHVGDTGTVASFDTNSFDIVSSIFNLEHLVDPSAFISGVSRILRPGGILQIAIPVADSLQFEMMGPYFFWAMAPFHITLFTTEGLDLLLAKHGFERTAKIGVERSWYWTKAIVDRLGLAASYAKWREDADFISFDIELDRLLDAVALRSAKPSSSIFLYKKAS
jgi:2-polyprenyl-3-methyl-5-hydroxy-6-metoxy-1,4-benzoquinol methylase